VTCPPLRATRGSETLRGDFDADGLWGVCAADGSDRGVAAPGTGRLADTAPAAGGRGSAGAGRAVAGLAGGMRW